jgi:signal transduction histidine kinase
MQRRTLLLGAVVAGALAAPARAVEYASPEDARAMCERAAALVRSAGREEAFRAFNTAGNGFHDRDLYVFVLNTKADCLAHGGNPGLIGRNLGSLRDVDGKLFAMEMAQIQDTGWVGYRWRNPQTRQVEAKTSYMIRLDDVVIGVGAYKPA